MDLQAFKNTLSHASAPTGLTANLRSLWEDGRGRWQAAHDLVDSAPGTEAAWVHAYLHRKEGDIWNADYWYRRAGRTRPDVSLEEEWEDLVRTLLGQR